MTTPATHPSRVQRRVVIADDEPMIRDLIRIRLIRHGIEVIEAADGQEALERIRAVGPDLIVLDLKMPRMTGYEVMAQLQADVKTRQIPVVIITAHGSYPPSNPCIENAAAYVMKPFSAKALTETILRLLPAT